MPKMLTVREAAREADVSNQHITRLINDGVLKAEKVGFQFVLDRPSFDAWLIKTGRKSADQSDQGGESDEGAESDQGEAEQAEARA